MLDKYIYNTLHFIMKWAGKINSWAWREHVKILRSDRWKKIKKKYLTPEEESEGDIIAEPAQAFDGDRKDLPWEENGSNFSLDTSKSKQNKVDQFDSLFNE
jgi:hypothetical protein